MAQPVADMPDLGSGHEWKLARRNTDGFGQTHTQWQHYFQGLRVEGSVLITHQERGLDLPSTPSPGLALGSGGVRVMPAIQGGLEPTLALKDVESIIALQGGPVANPPRFETAELILFPALEHLIMTRPGQADPPNATDYPVHVAGYRLAYGIEVQQQPGVEAFRYVVDAHTGALLQAQPVAMGLGEPAKAKGLTIYSGEVELDVTRMAEGKGYALLDKRRGVGGNQVLNGGWLRYPKEGKLFSSFEEMVGAGPEPEDPILKVEKMRPPELVTSPDPVFGGPEVPGGLSGNGFAMASPWAAADAAYGLQCAWDYFLNVHGRNGYDGAGGPMRVVINALNVDDACEYKPGGVIEIGPSAMELPNVSPMTIGHEFTHGVMEHTTTFLNWPDETSGLNEGTCDFFGQMVDTWQRTGGGRPGAPETERGRIGDAGTAWAVSYRLRHGGTRLMRDMVVPSRTGGLDVWNFDAMWGKYSNAYRNAGPLSRALRMLSAGASAKPDVQPYSDRIPAGMHGIGNDATARIWYQALLQMVGGHTRYLQAREAALEAARRLYGPGSAEVRAVAQAFAAIHVGAPEDIPFHELAAASELTIVTGPKVVLTLATPDPSKVRVADFHVDGISQGRLGGPPFTLTLPATERFSNGTHRAKVYLSNATGDVVESAEVAFTLDNPVQQLLGDPGLEARNFLATRWTTSPALDLIRRPPAEIRPRGGEQCAWFAALAGSTNLALHQRVTIPAEMINNQLVFWYRAGGESKAPTADSLAVQLWDTARPEEPPTVLASFTGADRPSGWVQRTCDLSAFAGRTVEVRFSAKLGTGSSSWFAVDDVTLQASAAARETLPVFDDFLADADRPTLTREQILSLMAPGERSDRHGGSLVLAARFKARGRIFEIGRGLFAYTPYAGGEVFGGSFYSGSRSSTAEGRNAWLFHFDAPMMQRPDGSWDEHSSKTGLVDFAVLEVTPVVESPSVPAPSVAPAPEPQARIESRKLNPSPGEAVELRIEPESLAGIGWTWAASGGTLVDLDRGRAGFRVPSSAVSGNVFRITATAKSGSSTRPAQQAVIELRVP